MIKLLVAVAFVGSTVLINGADIPKPSQGKNEPLTKEKSAASLKVGDTAPDLKAGKWLQGNEVKRFERGKVYVVEFWATWCGWCIIMMPHSAELQAQYQDKGVTFIYFSARDPDNSAEKVATFVQKRGPRLKFTFAYADDRTTHDNWVTAAGREGLPCVFVVDKEGRIAYVGHPMFLGVVLPKVVAGDVTGQAISDEVDKIWEECGAVSNALARDPNAGIKALVDFETKYPALADVPPHVRAKLSYLPKFGIAGEAKAFIEALVAKAINRDDPETLGQVSSILRLGDGKDNKELMALAVKAAEAKLRMEGERNALALIELAGTYHVAGDETRAKQCAREAIAAGAGESAALKQYIEQEAKRIDGEKKEDQK